MILPRRGFVSTWEASDPYTKIVRAIARGVVGFYRQSSLMQARFNVGSQAAQEDQVRHLEPFGVGPEGVHVVLAYGESGRSGVVRRKFRELMRLVRGGKVGLILLARHDRVGRNTKDSRALYDLLVEHQVLLMVDGRIYDPADEGDAFILNMYAAFAEYENRARARWIMLSRLAKARRLEARIPLPTGLVWASLDDPVYVQRMMKAELGAWVDAAREPGRHLAKSIVGDQTCYVLPFPDRDVARSIELRLQWLLEEGSMPGLLDRILHDPAWPHPGKMPVMRRNQRFDPEITPSWEHEATLTRLYDWFRSPALYGVYSYTARGLLPKAAPKPVIDLDEES
jgi:DNA invertase Pin-like site-specific DNA recombinase